MKMLTASTFEIDESKEAYEEILAQLDLENTLEKNAVGILNCHSDFVETGTAQYISQKLPFDVLGCTTLASGVNGEYGSDILTLTVLTGDNVTFGTGYAPSLETDYQQAVCQAVDTASATNTLEKPALIIPFIPLMQLSVEDVMDIIEEKVPGVPMFGTASVDSTPEFEKCYTFYNGDATQTGFSVLFIWGDIQPRFYVTAIPEDRIQNVKGIITKSEKNVLMEINNMSFLDYMNAIGLETKNGLEGVVAMPFMIDTHDGAGQVARALHTMTEENYASYIGNMAQGATFAVGSIDDTAIIETSSTVIEHALTRGEHHGMLVFPCASRYFILSGIDSDRELCLVREAAKDTVPFMMTYSGGEICPVYDKKTGNLINRFHNFSLAICIF